MARPAASLRSLASTADPGGSTDAARLSGGDGSVALPLSCCVVPRVGESLPLGRVAAGAGASLRSLMDDDGCLSHDAVNVATGSGEDGAARGGDVATGGERRRLPTAEAR